MTSAKDHGFWADTLDVTTESELLRAPLMGHRQVTDAYLLTLAISKKGKLATLDGGVTTSLIDVELRTKHLEIVA